MMENPFGKCNPIVNFIYFAGVILIGMFFINPYILTMGIIGAVVYNVWINGMKAVKFSIVGVLPMLIITSLINPLFNHRGATILFYLKNGNPITLESILYGVAAGAMFVTVICWFACYNKIMTSDKFIYIFGRVIPSMSLILSMVLRLVPRLKEQYRVINNAQIAMGEKKKGIKSGIKMMSILVTWLLENSIDTADSMRARGYGLKGRTSFGLYKWDSRDTKVTVIILGIMALIGFGSMGGYIETRYYPTIYIAEINIYSIGVYTAFGVLTLLPTLMGVIGEIHYRRVVK